MRSTPFNKAGLLAVAALTAATMSTAAASPVRRYTPPLYRARLARAGQPDADDLERLALAQAKRERKQQKRVRDILRRLD